MLTVQEEVITKSGARFVVDALRAAKVNHIFGYPGACILSLYNELADVDDVSHCLCRHEQACVHAAEGFAKISGSIGVVLVTSGPGATNTVTGIANAFADCTPLLVLAGASNETEGKVFQNVDFESMVKKSVKKFYKPTLQDDIFSVILDAVNSATTGKKGPVVVQLTRNLLEKTYTLSKKQSIKQKVIISNDKSKINQLISMIESSKTPLFLVGGGCRDSFNSISKLSAELKINTVTTLMGVGNVNTSSLYYKGMVGVNGTYEANDLLYNSDLIIAFGVAFSDRTTCKSEVFANNTPIVNVNLEPSSADNVNVVLDIIEDCNSVIEELLSKKISVKTNILQSSGFCDIKNSKTLGTSEVLQKVNSYTAKLNPIIITDVGQHQMLAAQCFEFVESKRFLTSGGLGTMGFGLPASCGAHFAKPDACIINITGDGSFQMNIQELATVREYQIPVKIFVMNNGYLGMIRQTQEKLYGGRYYQSKMNNPDFITLAKGYDIQGFRITSIPELEEALPLIFGNGEPIIVDCITDEFENV